MDLAEIELAKGKALRASEEMAAKYETEKKELKITALEEEKRLMTWLGIAGGIVLLLALASFFLLWRWAVQKRKVAEQQQQLAEQQQQLAETRIRQLEQEKQLIATQAVLDGETQERTRLARDLHDGLGSILAGTRLNLQEMKKGVVMNQDMSERYNTASGLLDESIREMRRIAHHLMPEALSAAGLKQATADFCSSIPHASFSYYGDETRLDTNMEIVIYRIMHELVSNALKHSGAGHIFVQIVREAGMITLTVEDNGCGFDLPAASKGMGLANIRTRVAAFNGNLTVDAKPGMGTEVHVELKINR
jgi:signal transduction histidine kinase